jgi:hypothetical protein
MTDLLDKMQLLTRMIMVAFPKPWSQWDYDHRGAYIRSCVEAVDPDDHSDTVVGRIFLKACNAWKEAHPSLDVNIIEVMELAEHYAKNWSFS